MRHIVHLLVDARARDACRADGRPVGAAVDAALPSGAARRAIARTLPAHNASTRILERLGMRFAGEAIDPDDGPVWRWELPTGR